MNLPDTMYIRRRPVPACKYLQHMVYIDFDPIDYSMCPMDTVVVVEQLRHMYVRHDKQYKMKFLVLYCNNQQHMVCIPMHQPDCTYRQDMDLLQSIELCNNNRVDNHLQLWQMFVQDCSQ